jgi:hypothetical protein
LIIFKQKLIIFNKKLIIFNKKLIILKQKLIIFNRILSEAADWLNTFPVYSFVPSFAEGFSVLTHRRETRHTLIGEGGGGLREREREKKGLFSVNKGS